ncbi:unnamed protein product [Anisakis simplex]|uniref:DNA_ligase_A_N domain-containing protein n=1 Tax=Anisakis simplex TaxID=6269 RepID=A0A0M3KDP4_ANISI|nr:unnamed protein product [Anisakis simplex]
MDTEEDEIDECSLAISKEFKFSLLCEYLQCIKNVPKQAKTSRRRIFTSLLEKWSSYNRSQSQTTESTSNNYTASFYPALRLIINAYDNRKFNMKSVIFPSNKPQSPYTSNISWNQDLTDWF